MHNKSRLALMGLCLLALAAAGCSEEKAKAIALAAEDFGRTSEEALASIDDLFTQSVAMPAEADSTRVDKMATDMADNTPFEAAELNQLMTEGEVGLKARDILSNEFDSLRARFVEVRTMFRTLPMGPRLSKKAVADSEKLLMRLTGDLYKMGANLAKQPAQFTGRRTLLVELIQNDKKIVDKASREARLRADAHSLLQLRRDELAARTAAVQRCYLAAEAGRSLSDMARHYGDLDVQSILDITKDSMKLAADLTFQSNAIDGLAKRIEHAEGAIRSDPYWKVILEPAPAR